MEKDRATAGDDGNHEGGGGPEVATLTADGSSEPVPRLAVVARATPSEGGEPPALPPAITDRYELLALLGRGGMGAVYRARDPLLGREVALKVLFDGDGERLLREARAQARVDHPHACKIHEVGVEGGASYIAMQLVDGGPLDAIGTSLTIEEKALALRQVALALHEAHRLGLVHRDVKPSNILVARGEDGTLHPYLTDFGIAREVGAEGHTVTGGIAGTPAFMAPEQARGEVRSLDRRTDVYGLGATAFALFAGRPPFEGQKPWTLIPRILAEDAPPLRRVAPEIPADLEAIVARCLEKDPGRRYPSARAVADDLQRFLDGDPVEARRISKGYLLLRWARRRRAAVMLASALIAAAAVVAALWIADRRRAAKRAEIARELSEDVKEMELFLRAAYALPLHDVEREREVVRDKLRGVEARLAAAGEAGRGPGRYALGRGWLALQEPDRALPELRAARAAGVVSAELDYAMGLALGELYDRAVVEARRIDDAERRQARLAALAAELAAPARRHLRAALAARLDAPAYVEGLIALREGKLEEALAKAQAAAAQAPWFHDAKRLEGDVRSAMGSRFGHDAAFDYDRMMVDFHAAAEAYRAAAEIGRSDPRVHAAECRLRAQIMNASTARRETLGASHQEAVAACRRAVDASSKSAAARIELAFVQTSYAWLIETGGSSEPPGAVIDDAIALATEAARLAPHEPMAPYLVGLGWSARAMHQNNLGGDSRASLDRAVAAYEGALRLDPSFVWALNDLASAHLQRAVGEGFRGIDPSPTLELAVAQSERASSLDPRGLNAWSTRTAALLLEAEHLVDTGRDPARPLQRAGAAIEAARALAPDWPPDAYFSAYAALLDARYAIATGAAPAGALARGEAIAREAVRRAPEATELHEVLGKLAVAQAEDELERGRDPRAAIEAGRTAFERVLAARRWDVGAVAWRARVEIIDLRRAARERTVAAAAAAAPLVALLDKPRADPGPAAVLAELRAVEASSRTTRGKPADEVIRDGLRRASEALALNPRLPTALAAKGELSLARARAAKDPRERREAARAAADALTAAARANPLFERRVEVLLRSARELGEEE